MISLSIALSFSFLPSLVSPFYTQLQNLDTHP